MSAIKFSCPGCGQHIECDAGYAGTQVNCPACQAAMVVPGTPASAPAPTAATIRAASTTCPTCHAALPAGAIICTSCGYNLRTGQRIKPQTQAPVRVPKKATGGIGTGNWIAISLLVVFGALFGLGFMNETMAAVFQVAAILFFLAIHIMVVIAAFQEGAGQGLMTLCIPCYALYFVYARSENPTLKMLYSLALLVRLAGFAVPIPGR